MKWSHKEVLDLLTTRKRHKLFNNSKHALEREYLRIDENGDLSEASHPASVGASLTHPYITTDFAEAQVELISPPFHREEHAATFLRDLHCFIEEKNPEECIWPLSMPCRLPNEKKIQVAQFGNSRTAAKKTLYRIGLAQRYGKKMQTVSGTHYNFSFSEEFWDFMYKKFADKEQSKQDFISESYFHLIRNFLRESWINTYLFGASPAIDKTYIKHKHKSLKRKGWNTYYGKYATSLRMSNIGYYSKVQSQLAISVNSLPEYIADMKYAVETESPSYKKLDGLNSNILQLENEHYSRIRAKQVVKEGESVVEALEERGVQYIEVRALDINPYRPIGIARHQLRFLQIFLLHCLLKNSPKISEAEQKLITENQNKVALYGRKPGLTLKTKKSEKELELLLKKILKEMEPIAELLDQNFTGERYIKTLNKQLEKAENPKLLSSARMLREMKENKESLQEFGFRLAQEHKEEINACKTKHTRHEMLEKVAVESHIDCRNLEIREASQLEGYEDMEVSTQMLIREAQARNIDVEVLDRQENLIKLSKGKKIEYIRQATFTSKDSQISYYLMENKAVSKKVLREAEINVPIGKDFSDIELALNSYKDFSKAKIVVKPTSTNFGIGISFIEKNDFESYKKAVEKAFKHGHSIIVEEFITGNEFRFLIIDDEVEGIVQRIPANITGNGTNTIEELIEMKNRDATNYKFFKKYHIKKGVVEKAYLKSQGLTFKHIPEADQQIFLRENSNVSTGGDSIDFTNQIHKSYKKIAIECAKAIDAKICGVDMMIQDISEQANEDNHSIIEINFNPSLHIHGFPVSGEVMDVEGAVLDLLGF